MIKRALFSLISFSLVVFSSDFFYRETSMLDMTKTLTFSNVNDVICFAMLLYAHVHYVLFILRPSLLRKEL